MELPFTFCLIIISPLILSHTYLLATDCLDVPRHVASLALKFFDMNLTRRFEESLPNQEPPPQEEFQLLAVACFHLAIKLLWTDYGWSTQKMCRMAGGAFEPKQIVQEEYIILETLQWRMHPPLANDFFHSFLALVLSHYADKPSLFSIVNSNEFLYRAYYIIELAMLDYVLIENDVPTSCVALGALSNTMFMMLPCTDYMDPFCIVSAEMQLKWDRSRYLQCSRRLWDTYTASMARSPSKKAPKTSRTSSPASVTQDLLHDEDRPERV